MKLVPYEVLANDTVEKISIRFNISPSELVKMNRMLSRLIYPGQKLLVPSSTDPNTHDTEERQAPDAQSRETVSAQRTRSATVSGIGGNPYKDSSDPHPSPSDNRPPSLARSSSVGKKAPPSSRSTANGLKSTRSASGSSVPSKKTTIPRSMILPETDEEEAEQNDPRIQNFVKTRALYFNCSTDVETVGEEALMEGILLVTPNVLMFDSDSCRAPPPFNPTKKSDTDPGNNIHDGTKVRSVPPAASFSFMLQVEGIYNVSIFPDVMLEYSKTSPIDPMIQRIRSIIPCGEPSLTATADSVSPALPPHDYPNPHHDQPTEPEVGQSWEVRLASQLGPVVYRINSPGKVLSPAKPSECRSLLEELSLGGSDAGLDPDTTSKTFEYVDIKTFTCMPSSTLPQNHRGAIIFVQIKHSPNADDNANGGGGKSVNHSFAKVNSSHLPGADDYPQRSERWFGLSPENADKLFIFLDECFKNRKRKSSKNPDEKTESPVRPLEIAEESIPMIGSSEILDPSQILQLSLTLPPRAIGYYWILAYSTSQHGFCLNTFYRKMKLCDVDSPVLLVIRDKTSQTFGALTSCPIRANDHFYGTGETFLYSFYPTFKIYKWSGENSFFMKGDNESIVVGSGNGLYGLWLDADFYHGRTHKCATFDNDPLTIKEDFIIDNLEAWYFGDPPPLPTVTK